ncbi:MAG: hypothetical protein KJ971_03720 [Firmicutes bacterium]|nr:hypothetical protein [Bacillota bacterium]
MKTRQIKMLIRETALKEMPEILNKIDLSSIEIIPAFQEENAKPFTSLRRVLTYSFSFLFILVSSVLIFNSLSNPVSPYEAALENETEIIGFQAVSATSLLSESFTTPLSLSMTSDTPSILLLGGIETTSVIESEIDIINKYLNMMEVVIGNKETLLYQSKLSEDDAYQTQISFKSMDLLGNLVQFQLYYNTTQDGDLELIDGIMIHNEITYTIHGELSNSGEVIQSQFQASIDENNYVIVQDITDTTGQKFLYKIYENASLINESEISLDLTNTSIKAKINTRFQNENCQMNIEKADNGAANSGFSVNYILNNETSLVGQIDVSVEMNQVSGMYQYRYTITENEDTDEIICNRQDKGNTQANDDDFTTDDDSDDSNDTNTTTSQCPGRSDNCGKNCYNEDYLITSIKNLNVI